MSAKQTKGRCGYTRQDEYADNQSVGERESVPERRQYLA
jgi:hypothetical protein